jgi:hypothetical protein
LEFQTSGFVGFVQNMNMIEGLEGNKNPEGAALLAVL